MKLMREESVKSINPPHVAGQAWQLVILTKKGHNGTLEVDTTSGVGTEFIVHLSVV